MSSSTFVGDRRWASSRKGMTVLGKVPKPINLPSQRLENHGLDPNVEIVPKGTLSWGSRPSNGPNAWGSSTNSPSSADGSIGSPSHHNVRPSSGGTGTRPSTAGSDSRCSEPAPNAWASTSRPSSASGILASNQAPLAATRPRSAESRPVNSHLSRFAEPIPENSGPWSIGSAGHLGTSKTGDFTLSSGDFPTLGTEKNSGMHDQQDVHGSYGHTPISTLASTEKAGFDSPRGAVPVTGAVLGSQAEKQNPNAWKVDDYAHMSDDSSMHFDTWPANRQSNHPSSNPNTMNTQTNHHNWHGPPQSPHDGVWFRGISPPGHYGSGVCPPGKYLPDPYVYNSSHQAAGPGPNLNPSPTPRAILGGYPHGNEESFRPQKASDSYMDPIISVIPMRPGVYANAISPDGYYGAPHASFSTSSGRERPAMGMVAGPVIYNQFSNQNDYKGLGKFSGSPGAIVKEQVERHQSRGSHGEQCRVLLKNHDGLNITDSNSRGHLNVLSLQPVSKKDTDAWEEEPEINLKGVTKTAKGGICAVVPRNSSTEHTQMLSSKDITSSSEVQVGGDCQIQKVETVLPPSDVQLMKKSRLIEKIEGLNNKLRVIDGHGDAHTAPLKEEKSQRSQLENVKAIKPTEVMQPPSATANKDLHDNILTGSKSTLHDNQGSVPRRKFSGYSGNVKTPTQQSTMSGADLPDNHTETLPIIQAEHTRGHFSHDRTERYSNSRGSNNETRRIKTPVRESLPTTATRKSDKGLVNPQDDLIVNDNPGKQKLLDVQKVADESSLLHSTDHHSQRAKMKELATQRAKQLQREEEERNRDQKAKALAKLKELEKRALADAPPQNVGDTSKERDVLSYKQDKVPDKKIDATETASGLVAEVNGDDLCTIEGIAAHKNSKDASTVVHSLVSCRTPMLSNVMHKVDFTINKQISFGTVQAHDSEATGINILPMMPKCEFSFDKHKDETDIPVRVSHVSQSDPRNSILQESCLMSVGLGNQTSKRTNDYVSESSARQKHPGNRRRNATTAIPLEKNVTGLPLAPSDAAAPLTPEVVAETTTSDWLIQNSVGVGGSVQPKKKTSRNAKSRNRSEQGPLLSAQALQAQSDGIIEKPPESCKIELAVPIEVTGAPSQNVGGTNDSKVFNEGIMPANSGYSGSAEEGNAKTASQWKPHPSRRTRNGQSRLSDKFRASEGVIWAPVRPSSKCEPVDENQTVKYPDSLNNSGSDAQDAYTRAEIERDVPKFVAKDASPHKKAQKTLASVHATTDSPNDEIDSCKGASNADEQTSVKSEVTVEIKSMDVSRPSKHGRGYASWRQRSTSEVSPESMNPVAEYPDQILPPKTGSSPNMSHLHLNGDGKDPVVTISPSPSEPVTTLSNDLGMLNRGKHQGHRMQKPVEANSTRMVAKSQNATADKPNVHATSVNSDNVDRKGLIRSENASQVERTRTHWKPKSTQPSLSQNLGFPCRDVSLGSNLLEESSVQASCSVAKGFNEGKHIMQSGNSSIETGNSEKCQARKEVTPIVGASQDANASSGKDSSNLVDEQTLKTNPKSGSHRLRDVQLRKGQEVSHGGRYNRGQEAHYGGRNIGQDSSYQTTQASSDWRRQNSHYEYQRVEAHLKNDQQQQNSSAEDSMHYGNFRAAGSRYRERGHLRHGGQFHARGGAPVQGGETQQ